MLWDLIQISPDFRPNLMRTHSKSHEICSNFHQNYVDISRELMHISQDFYPNLAESQSTSHLICSQISWDLHPYLLRTQSKSCEISSKYCQISGQIWWDLSISHGISPNLVRSHPNLTRLQSKSHENSYTSPEIIVKSCEIPVQISWELGPNLMRSSKSCQNSVQIAWDLMHISQDFYTNLMRSY